LPAERFAALWLPEQSFALSFRHIEQYCISRPSVRRGPEFSNSAVALARRRFRQASDAACSEWFLAFSDLFDLSRALGERCGSSSSSRGAQEIFDLRDKPLNLQFQINRGGERAASGRGRRDFVSRSVSAVSRIA
jgi:hypothetical protein